MEKWKIRTYKSESLGIILLIYKYMCIYIYWIELNLIPSLSVDIFLQPEWIHNYQFTRPLFSYRKHITNSQNVGIENVWMEPMRELLLLRIQRQASVSRCGTREDSITRWDEGISRDVQIRDRPWFSVRRLWYLGVGRS